MLNYGGGGNAQWHLPSSLYKMGEKTIPGPVDLKNHFSFTLQTLLKSHWENVVDIFPVIFQMRVLPKSTFFAVVCPLKKDCLTLVTVFRAPYWIALQLALRQKGWRELIFKILCTQDEHSMFVHGCWHTTGEAWITLQGTLKCQDWNTSVLDIQCPGFVAYTCFMHI